MAFVPVNMRGVWQTAQPVDWKTAPLPDLQPQENMPDAATAPAHAATDVPFEVNVGGIDVPAKSPKS